VIRRMMMSQASAFRRPPPSAEAIHRGDNRLVDIEPGSDTRRSRPLLR